MDTTRRRESVQPIGLYEPFPTCTQPSRHPNTQRIHCGIFSTADFGYAIGYHEVVIESPNHDEDPADATLTQLELVIESLHRPVQGTRAKSYVKYVSIFRNYGLDAGASLSHAHSQIIATPMIPPPIQEEKQAADKYQKEHGKCVFCDIIEREVKTQRLILENSDFAVIAPYASINPMEFWILPKRHAPNIQSLTKLKR